MKKNVVFIAALFIAALWACNGKESQKESQQGGIIRVEVPERPAGQEDVVALRCEALDTVRVGFIGLGMRGPGAVERFTYIPGTKVVALCDLLPERAQKAQEILKKRGLPAAVEYSGEDGWKALCEREDINLVYIATPWQLHVEMAVYAMEHGKHVAVEVPAAMDLEECWKLVNTAERTRLHCMMLENCVYDFFELTTLNMAQQGLFGTIEHVEGAYNHNLEEFWPYYQGNWRLDFNEKHGGDVYATHGLGPACQLLDIHRGNRMTHMVAMQTQAINGPKMVKKFNNRESKDFKNADQTLTLIQTSNGQVIHLQHNVMTPRPYSRMYQVTGTEGFANKYPVEGYCFHSPDAVEGMPDHENLSMHSFVPENVKAALMEKYKHPIHRELEEMAKKVGGHGGMDFIMDYRLVYCLRNGLPLDQDVYDAAEWSCIGELTRISIENNNMPVEVPDFTRGAWKKLNGYHHFMAGE